MKKLTKLEQETIILWNNAEELAIVYTCDPRIKRLLSKSSIPNKKNEDEYSVTYNLPKKHCSFIFRNIESEKSKEKRQINMTKAREAKKNAK